MKALYNECDPGASAWLRELAAAGMIAPGDVDSGDIRDVLPAELVGRTQCHFFAGIGVWSYALRLAGWADDRPCWTGSCPCQPFSEAGRREGLTDERHLWPSWFHLIEQCRPPVVFGEQVASGPAAEWLDLVHSDLEGIGYAVGAAVLPAAGVGAPHGRHRIFFVADCRGEGLEVGGEQQARRQRQAAQRGCGALGLADDDGERFAGRAESNGEPERSREPASRRVDAGGRGFAGDRRPVPTNGHWRDADWLRCRDGRWRPVEPGTFPLAHGAPGRVGRLRGYGNAIVAQVAAAFIAAYMEAIA